MLLDAASFRAGQDSGKNGVIIAILNDSDKPSTIRTLFVKASNLANKESDPLQKARLQAYAEGLRHSLHILVSYGNALEEYNDIPDPKIKIPITKDDVQMFS